MENATKALLLAGGILLGILVITAGVILYNNLNNNNRIYNSERETTKLQQINVKFEAFIGRDDITIHEIISLYNYIEDNKEKLLNSITLKVGNEEYKNLKEQNKIEKMEQNNHYKLEKILYNETTGQVRAITFKEKS